VKINSQDVWGKIPPEEKLVIHSEAHSTGVVAGLIITIASISISIGYNSPLVMWCGFLLVPFSFHIASQISWKKRKPALILEYLAARSASRRFAFQAKASDLTVKLLMRASLTLKVDDEEDTENLGARKDINSPNKATNSHKKIPKVWVALFEDTLVIMSENPGGARAEFIHSVNEKLKIKGYSPEGEGEYSSERKLELGSEDWGKYLLATFVLESMTPGALIVLEKKLLALKEEAIFRASLPIHKRVIY
jgi:hypothetical protein